MVDSEWLYTGGISVIISCENCGQVIANKKITDIEDLMYESLENIEDDFKLKNKSLCERCITLEENNNE